MATPVILSSVAFLVPFWRQPPTSLADLPTEKLNVWPIYEFFDQLRKEVEEGVLSRLKKMKSLDENGRNDEYASMTPLVQEMGKNSKEILKDVPIEARLTSA